LEEAKYFQNEITNVELKQVATNAGLDCGTEGQLQEVILLLAKTERNQILEKGQSTIGLEQMRLDGLVSPVDQLIKLLPMLKVIKGGDL
jgi:hypothetical protein